MKSIVQQTLVRLLGMQKATMGTVCEALPLGDPGEDEPGS